MREIADLPTITGVAPGATVSQTIPVGPTYDRIHFMYSGVTPSQIKNVSLNLGTNMVTEYATLQDLIDENNRFKRVSKEGVTTWHFVNDQFRSAQHFELVEQRMFSLGTAGVRSVQIKFQIDKDATAEVEISAYAEKSAPVAPGWLMKRRSFYYTVTNGRVEVQDLPRPPNASICAIAIKAPGIKGVEFLVDNVKWRESIPLDLHNHIMEQNGKTPIAGEFYLDFCLEGDKYGTLFLDPAIRDMRLRIDGSEQAQAEVVVYYMDNFAVSTF
ncbi:capsid protein [Pseudoalteromonas sp. MMG013]|uniref:major capsid protein P2 n=1 Tax=Pseudoalteromonas sp. MMG013 TaxID=2822687 RepID=UPI001B372D96|nr:major capsid protein P2 [Pseudoalteromonas sp. MMG013]MBQ4860342.1 capsid protein [Pseudoalteromonas sp. MMG013]